MIVGYVIRNVSPAGRVDGWRTELLEDLPPKQRPSPFSVEHAFDTREAAKAWIDGTDVVENTSD